MERKFISIANFFLLGAIAPSGSGFSHYRSFATSLRHTHTHFR